MADQPAHHPIDTLWQVALQEQRVFGGAAQTECALQLASGIDQAIQHRQKTRQLRTMLEQKTPGHIGLDTVALQRVNRWQQAQGFRLQPLARRLCVCPAWQGNSHHLLLRPVGHGRDDAEGGLAED